VCSSVLQCVAVYCSVLQCVAVCCTYHSDITITNDSCRSNPKRQCLRRCCSVLQCDAVCCSVLQCVAVCCSVLQCVAVAPQTLQFIAVCFIVLQSFCRCPASQEPALGSIVSAVCCSVLQRLRRCCSVLQCVCGLVARGSTSLKPHALQHNPQSPSFSRALSLSLSFLLPHREGVKDLGVVECVAECVARRESERELDH